MDVWMFGCLDVWMTNEERDIQRKPKVLQHVEKVGKASRYFGAGGGTRTPTGFRPTDFKSGVSTIPPRPHLALSSKFSSRPITGQETASSTQRLVPYAYCRTDARILSSCVNHSTAEARVYVYARGRCGAIC